MMRAKSVPLNVPRIRGKRLSFDSKSSVAPVDCQAQSGAGNPSYQTRPKRVPIEMSGWALRTVHRLTFPFSWAAKRAVALGERPTHVTGDSSLLSVRSTRSDVELRRTTVPDESPVANPRCRCDAAIAVTGR